jgi:hypothetical protein
VEVIDVTPEEQEIYLNAWTVYLTAMESVVKNDKVAAACQWSMTNGFSAADLSVILMPFVKQAAAGGAVDWDGAVSAIRLITGYPS